MKATLLKVGDARILELMPAEEDAFQIAAHTPPDDTKLRIALLDSQWLRAQASVQLALHTLDGRLDYFAGGPGCPVPALHTAATTALTVRLSC